MKYSEEQYNSILEDCRAYKNNFDFLQKVSENLLNANKDFVREIDG